MSRERHPAAELFPEMSSEEFSALKASIEANGLREPITLLPDGRLLDGRHREAACETLGVEPETRIYNGDDPWGYAVEQNGQRRHLNASQKAMVAAQIANMRQGERTDLEPSANLRKVSLARAAENMGVGSRSVESARAILDYGDEKIIKEVKSGVLAVSKAERIVRERQAKDAAKKAEEEIEKSRPEPQLGEWWRLGGHLLYCGDTSKPAFRERVTPAAFAFADPPYGATGEEWDETFYWEHDWLSELSQVVAVTPGVVNIQKFMQTTTMPYRWSVACWIDNGMTRGGLGFGNWIYAALFSDNPIAGQSQDFVRTSIQGGSKGHKGQKPVGLMQWLLDRFSGEGDTVVDPFLGSGTTLLVAEQMGRRCIGGEINPGYCAEIITAWQGLSGEVAVREDPS